MSGGRRRDAAAERAERLLSEAQAVADRILEDARVRAERVLAETQAAGERFRAEAQARADRIREDAQSAAEKVVDDARQAAKRVRHEVPRKAIHLSSISIPLGILYVPVVTGRRILMLVGLALLVGDLVRIHHPKLRTYFTAFFGNFIRRHERRGITGSTYLVISSIVTMYLFEREVAAAALIFLIVGDTLAAMVGMAWGRTPLFGKTVEGFLAGFVFSFLAAWGLVPSLGAGTLAIGAFAAAVVEVLPIPVDDNFRIPLLAGLVLEWLH